MLRCPYWLDACCSAASSSYTGHSSGKCLEPANHVCWLQLKLDFVKLTVWIMWSIVYKSLLLSQLRYATNAVIPSFWWGWWCMRHTASFPLSDWDQADWKRTVIFSFFHGTRADDDYDVVFVLLALTTFVGNNMVYKGPGLDLTVEQATFINVEGALQLIHSADDKVTWGRCHQ